MSAETEKAANRLESLVLTLLFTVISSCLFAILTDVTRSNARGGWWTQPWLMPALALGVLALSNVLTLARTLADLRAGRDPDIDAALRAIGVTGAAGGVP